jgi:hypothetical protein
MAKAIAPTPRTALKDGTTLPRWQTPTRLRPMLATAAGAARPPPVGGRSNCSPHPETAAPSASMMVHGFSVDILADMVRAKLAAAKIERVMAGGRPTEVVGVRITDAGWRTLSKRAK